MKCSIGGVYFDNVTMDEAVASIEEMVRGGSGPHLVCTANLDHLASLRKDSEFLAVYKTADLILADGMPIVWLSRCAGTPLKERVAGSDLLWQLSAASARTGLRLFLLGGQPGACDKAAEKLRERHPDVQIVGCYCPPSDLLATSEEDAKIAQLISTAKPDVLLVGFGAPKQEKWIAAHRDTLRVPVAIGVGGSFDMAAGLVRRAPMWMQRSGFEWAFRLMQEPRRLWRRYFGCDLPYLLSLYFDMRRERKHPAPNPASKPNG